MNRRLLLLSSVAVVLAAILLLDRQSAAPVAGPDPAARGADPLAATPQSDEEPLLNPLQDMAPESFTAILERPLFNPGRTPRPPDVPAAPVAAAEAPPPAEAPGPRAEDFKLVAISLGPAGRIAALRLAAGGDVLYLREGQPVQSWAVLAISDTSVVIGTAQSSIELTLFPRGAEAAGGGPASAAIPPLPPEIEDANNAYHAATKELDPYADTPPMQ